MPLSFPRLSCAGLLPMHCKWSKKKNPDYVLTIKHVTEYYDMKMVTFGVNDSEELVVAFPVFVQDHTRESMTLYELETVKVPITDTNLAANSYTEVETSKPYIAFNNDYYIQLHILVLCMCKQIWHSYYYEELFLVKHKSKHSCESAIYYNLSKEVINEYCSFKYFYNTTIMALHVFYFTTGIVIIVSVGPQIYACIKQSKLKTLVATMALYKVPGIDTLNGTLPLSAPIILNEGHAKYVCLDPWINALVTLASLGTIVAFLMVRCRKRTLCRGLEYATACHIYVFISRNDRYSPIKLRSTTG